MSRIAIFSLLVVILGCKTANTYTVVGTVEGTENGNVRLQPYGKKIMDSQVCEIQEGRFSFSGIISQPEEFMLIYEESGLQSSFEAYRVFLIPDHEVQIRLRPDSIKTSTIAGPRLSRVYDKANKELFQQYFSPMNDLEDAYNVAVENEDIELQRQLLSEADSLMAGMRIWQMDYIEDHPRSYISAFFLNSICQELPVEEVQRLYMRLKRRVHNLKYTKAIRNYLSVQPGNPYVDFEFTDSDGVEWLFSELARNKVTLIDFWASWCGPCREQNKLLSNLYKAHRQSGFEIVGASSDRDSASFRRVLMEDQLVWVNFLDRIDDGSVEDAYWANSVPSNVLIDRSGIIRYRNVEMEVLKETIEKLLDE